MKVLIGIDEQACIAEVANFVRQHQWPKDSEFLLINVVSPVMVDYPGVPYTLFIESCWDEIEKASEELLQVAKREIAMPGITVSTEFCVGLPVEVIVGKAKTLKADLIVLGTHGRQGLNKFILGSVSQEIASQAPCSVVVLRLAPVAVAASQPSAKTRLAAAT